MSSLGMSHLTEVKKVCQATDLGNDLLPLNHVMQFLNCHISQLCFWVPKTAKIATFIRPYTLIVLSKIQNVAEVT